MDLEYTISLPGELGAQVNLTCQQHMILKEKYKSLFPIFYCLFLIPDVGPIKLKDTLLLYFRIYSFKANFGMN